MDLTISVLKADVGSIGGHTKPSDRMMAAVRSAAERAIRDGLLIDAYVGHTGDDICITTTHTRGDNDDAVHPVRLELLFGSYRHRAPVRALWRRPGPAC